MVLGHFHGMAVLCGDVSKDGVILVALVWHVHNLIIMVIRDRDVVIREESRVWGMDGER